MTEESPDAHVLAQLESLAATGGRPVDEEEVGEVVESLMRTMQGDLSAVDFKMHDDVRELSDYIKQAKREIAAIRPEDIPAEEIPLATDELDAVVAATEEATGAILDAAEQLEALTGSVSTEAADKIMAITTKIFEASNFQDITGQRITKVVNVLHGIEEKVAGMTAAIGYEPDPDAPPPIRSAAADDGDLLNGPALPESANSQDDIDALFD